MYLYVDLPRFDFPVIYSESVGIPTINMVGMVLNSFQEAQNQATMPFAPPAAVQTPVPPVLPTSFGTNQHLWAIVDPEIARDNPVEDKHRRLVRSHRSSPYDRELKPNAKIRDELGVRMLADC
jgi:phosphatidylinositol 3-kinase